MSLNTEGLSKVIGGSIKQAMVAQTTTIAATLSSLSKLNVREPSPQTGTGLKVLGPFDEANETFAAYLERLEKHLEAKNLSCDTPEGDKKCVKILISSLPAKLSSDLKSLTAPEKPKSKKFAELCDLLTDHLNRSPTEVAQQRFSLRFQQPDETVSEYVDEIWRLAVACDFTCGSCRKSTVESHVRSQLIRGVKDWTIRQRLSRETEKSLDEVTELAVTLEQSQIESKSMEQASRHHINKMRKKAAHRSKISNLQKTHKYVEPCPNCGGDCLQEDSSPEDEEKGYNCVIFHFLYSAL